MQSISKRKFTNIGKVLSKILDNNNLGHLYALEEIKNGWILFDKTISAHSKRVEFNTQSGSLTIKVENVIWKKEFFENIETLTIKIKNAFRTINIKSIEII